MQCVRGDARRVGCHGHLDARRECKIDAASKSYVDAPPNNDKIVIREQGRGVYINGT